MRMYSVEAEHKKEFVFSVKSKGLELTIDALAREGISPPDALLASVATCLGVYIRKYSEGSGLGLENFKISVNAEFSKEPPVCFKEIYAVIDLKDRVLDERRRKPLLEFIKNCPVHNTLKGQARFEIKIL